MKQCTKCKVNKLAIEFYSDKRKSDGLRSWCKSCQKADNSKRESKYNEKRKLYRIKNKQEYKEKKKKYYRENKNIILSNNKIWRQSFKGKLLSYKKSALKRNLNWEITEKEFLSFYNLNCHYCNDKIIGIGIDRVNSDKGYTIDNIVPCCYQCNIMKMDYSKEEFLEKVKKICINMKRLKKT